MCAKKIFLNFLYLFLTAIFFYSCDSQKITKPGEDFSIISVCPGETQSQIIYGTQPVFLILNTDLQCNQQISSSKTNHNSINVDPNAKKSFTAAELPHWMSSDPTCGSVSPADGYRTKLSINSTVKCSTTITVEFSGKTSTINFLIDPAQFTQTYQIIGTVFGLSGTGLVLQNGSDTLSISSDGLFTFPTAITDGSVYNVVVATQPSTPNQTCTVTNGSGTISGSNVTDVSVVCTTNTYTIGGNVSGLSASTTALVLQNNGGNNLTISSNGAFTFSAPVADGGAYLVTVATQPSGPNQTCTVTNGSGTISGSNVTNVSVSCVTLMLNTATNVAVSGQNVTLTNNSVSQTNGFTLQFSNTGNLTCSSVSIQTVGVYAFIGDGSIFLPYPGASMPQYTCAHTPGSSTIELSSAPPLAEGFHPWVENFQIIVGGTTFTVTVNTPDSATQLLSRGAQSAMYLDSSFPVCGLRGTILQRVFDCSKKIVYYGATVTAGQATSNATGSTPNTYYTAYSGSDPDSYWFVVACPNTQGSSTVPQQSCHWLTPVVVGSNPALDSITPGTFPTFQLSMMADAYQPRLLFSGKMINGGTGYTFAQSNGFAFSATNEVYQANTTNPGTSPASPQPTHTSNSVCIAAATNSLQGGGTFPSSDADIRDIVSYATGATIGPIMSPQWQMPSYAILNILAGGRPTNGSGYCPPTGATRPNCNVSLPSPGNNQGFSAINVPGFAQTTVTTGGTCDAPTGCLEGLWSSSSAVGLAWSFIPLIATGSVGGFLEVSNPAARKLGTRCVALQWY